jgi:hypothetical protein
VRVGGFTCVGALSVDTLVVAIVRPHSTPTNTLSKQAIR